MIEKYVACRLCPNDCKVNRYAGRGICGETHQVRVAWAGLHKGEEPPVSGTYGSGTIFFSGCPLHCSYCQNYQISCNDAIGVPLSIPELASLMKNLENMGAHTLNLVTATHFIPSVIEALDIAKITIDVVWNSSGFESTQGLSLIDSYVDLYLIDLKTLDNSVASFWCGQSSYAQVIPQVFSFLKQNPRKTEVTSHGTLRGILVRHLVFPGELEATKKVLNYYAKTLKDCSWLSVMVQFVDPKQEQKFNRVTSQEYDELLRLLDELEIDNGFIQEPGDELIWIPDFTRKNPFPEEFALPSELFLEYKQLFEKKEIIT